MGAATKATTSHLEQQSVDTNKTLSRIRQTNLVNCLLASLHPRIDFNDDKYVHPGSSAIHIVSVLLFSHSVIHGTYPQKRSLSISIDTKFIGTVVKQGASNFPISAIAEL